MHVWISAFVGGAAAVAAAACNLSPQSTPIAPVQTPAPAPIAVTAPVAAPVALPPNADGDPPCPVADAWGKDPFGAGILVTHWSDDSAAVTVLVRTKAGNDQSQRAVLTHGELRLFEFPDIDQATVDGVLIMTNTRRCYVSADPAALG
ncbi:hypothetical protein ACGFK1_24345 [Mycobacterium sp. NPDC048908]|uniref:hypothetical protein n=1 Tax=Mycobacterium sp. NPDC048908 TaxID=3364292 RepID=UPI00371ABCE9